MNRLEQAKLYMKNKGISQTILCNPTDVFYLTGNHIMTGDRFMGIILQAEGTDYFITNPLHTNQKLPDGMQRVDITDGCKTQDILSSCLIPGEPVGIDPQMPANFLLPLIEKISGAAVFLEKEGISELRKRKDSAEIEKMKLSSQINDNVMAHLRGLLHEGITEKELFDRIENIYREHGADHMAFAGICFGENAAEPHHVDPENRKLKNGDCILLDIGGVKDNYYSDMTRTYFFGSASEEQWKVYELVRKANEAAEAVIRPGIQFCDVDKAARDVIEEAGYGKFFFHRTGHGIGLEVHEAPSVGAENKDFLQEGQVFSIEPGIYLAGKFGVRIEDLVVVTANGCEILNHLSKKLEIL